MSDVADILSDDGDDNNFSFRRILDIVTEEKELIVTVREEDVVPMKRNLATLKSRDAAKLKLAGLEPGDEVLSYDTLPCTEAGCTRIHIRLGPRKGIKIIKMEKPDDTF